MENKKIDPVQKVIDVQTVDNSKKICFNYKNMLNRVIDKRSEKCLTVNTPQKITLQEKYYMQILLNIIPRNFLI